MAISDYLMTKLALAAQARGLARGTEEARAQREAAAQRANLAYLNTLLESGGQLASKVPGMVEEAAAKESAARLQEALSAVGLPTDGAAPIPAAPTSAITPPAATPTTPTISAPTAPAAPAAAVRTLLGSGKDGELAFEKMQREKLGLPPPSTTELEARQLMESQTPPAGIGPEKYFSSRTAPSAATTPLAKFPQKTTTAVQPPSPPAAASPGEAIRSMGKDRVPSEEPLVPIPTFTGVPTPPVEIKAQALVTPPTERNATAEPTTTAPTGNPLSEGVESVKEQLKQLNVDPIEAARAEYIKKITSYTPQKHEKNSVQVANDIVEQVKKDRPAGNPIWNLLSFGEYNKKIEAADRLAKRLVAQEVEGLRTKQEEKRYAKFIQIANLEAEQLVAAQKKQLEEKKINIKVKNETLDTGKLQEKVYNYVEADRDLNNLINAGRKVIESKTGFPGGADREFNLLVNELGISVQPTTTSTGAAGPVSITKTGRTPDAAQMAAILKKVDENKSLSPAAKEFQRQMLLTIQKLGKAREGKSLTDADLKYYVASLLPSNLNNPRQLLEAINQLRDLNAKAYGDWNNVYGAGNPIWNIELQSTPFSEDELEAASVLNFAAMAPETKATAATARKQPGAFSAAEEGISAVQGAVQSLTGGTKQPQTTGAP